MDYEKGLTRDEVLELLKDLVRIESITGNESRIAAFICDYFKNLGLEPQVFDTESDGYPFSVRIEGKERSSIAFVGHIDTVDVKGQDWIHDPFGSEVEGELMYGRGSSDMKSGLACMIATAAWFKKNSIIPDKSLIFAFTNEEEKGYKGARKLTEEGVFDDCELVIIPEPTEGKICIGQKGQLWIDVVFTGKAAHAALPETGINAAVAASDFAVKITEACSRFDYKKGLGRTTGSVDEVHGGWQINVVPNVAKVGVDFRVVDEADHDTALAMTSEVSRAICEKWGVKSAINIRQYVAPVVSDIDNELVKRFIDSKESDKTETDKLSIVAYSTDGSVIIPAYKVPLIVYGPGSISKAHQQEECLVIGTVFEVLDRLIGFLSPDVNGIDRPIKEC